MCRLAFVWLVSVTSGSLVGPFKSKFRSLAVQPRPHTSLSLSINKVHLHMESFVFCYGSTSSTRKVNSSNCLWENKGVVLRHDNHLFGLQS
jgi:hypothetical protein